jgi:hypothetical protein
MNTTVTHLENLERVAFPTVKTCGPGGPDLRPESGAVSPAASKTKTCAPRRSTAPAAVALFWPAVLVLSSSAVFAQTPTCTPSRLDLVVSAASTPPPEISAGTGTFNVTDTVRNDGNGPAPVTKTRYRLSVDTACARSDPLLVGERIVPMLQAGEESSGTVTVRVPANFAARTWRFCACADDATQAPEEREDNNCRLAGTVAVRRADLLVSAVSNPPPVTVPGGTFSVTDTTCNNGLAPSSASVTAVEFPAGQAIRLGERAVPPLGVEECSTGTTQGILPEDTLPGEYSARACADAGGAVGESRETNNCLVASSGVAVVNPTPLPPGQPTSTPSPTPTRTPTSLRPDLVVAAFSNPPSLGDSGTTTFLVTETVRNNGSATAGVSVTRYRLSTTRRGDDNSCPTNTRLLDGVRVVPQLEAGEESSGTIGVAIPATMRASQYFLCTCANDLSPTVPEPPLDLPNCQASATRIRVQNPDLEVRELSSPPDVLFPGTVFSVADLTCNQGEVPAVRSVTTIHLFDGSTFRRLGVREVPPLAAGECCSGTVELTVPEDIDPGSYATTGCADGEEDLAGG